VTNRAPNSRESVRHVSFLARNVFPGSALPTVDDIRAAVDGLYDIRELKTIGLDHSRTLAQWDERLSAGRAELESRYGRALFEHFKRYFEAAKRQFDGGYVDLAQMSLRRVA
jgi:cyclopropane-fatty-acyl-phospholipid synthase